MTKSDPMLESIYLRAQEQERKRAVAQAKFDRDVADGLLDADGVAIMPKGSDEA